MSMIKAMRTLNAIENGTTSGAELQTLLADAGRLSELNVLFDMPGQARRIASGSTTITAISESALASEALAKSPSAVAALVEEDDNFETMLNSDNWKANATVVERLMTELATRNKIFSMKDITGALNSAASIGLSVTALSDTLALVCYTGTSTYGYAQVIKLVGSTVTLGTPTAFSEGIGASNVSVTRLSATSALVVYANVSTGYGNGVVLTIADTVVTFGSATAFNSVAAASYKVVAVSSTKAVAAWTYGGNVYAVVIAVSGTSISYGSTVNYATEALTPALVVISDTKVVLAYKNNSNFASAAVLTLSDATTITAGTAIALNSTAIVTISAVKISDVHVAVVFAASIAVGYLSILTINDATLATTTATAFTTEYVLDLNALKISSDTLAIVYRDRTATYCKMRAIKVNGTSFTVDSAITLDSGTDAIYVSATVLSGYRLVVCYRNNTTTYGTYRIVGAS